MHLFQLQKFKKVAFTNVAFLQKITQQTRKSSRLKKWLILATRLLLFLGIIFAFSQPFFPSKNSLNNASKNLLYLDNSLSLNSKGKKGDILQVFSNEILEFFSEDTKISLQTNDAYFKNVDKKSLNSYLKNIKKIPKSKNLKEILNEFQLKEKNEIKSLDNITFLSDFQNIKFAR